MGLMAPNKRKNKPKGGRKKKGKFTQEALTHRFPVDPLKHILSYLSPRDLLTTRQVSPHLKRLADLIIPPRPELVNNRWNHEDDYVLSSWFDGERAREIKQRLASQGVVFDEYDGHDDSHIPDFTEGPDYEDGQYQAFEDNLLSLGLSESEAKKEIEEFLLHQHHEFCDLKEKEMRRWAFYIFETYMQQINHLYSPRPRRYYEDDEAFCGGRIVEHKDKISIYDLYLWVEYHRHEKYGGYIDCMNDFEYWKSLHASDYPFHEMVSEDQSVVSSASA